MEYLLIIRTMVIENKNEMNRNDKRESIVKRRNCNILLSFFILKKSNDEGRKASRERVEIVFLFHGMKKNKTS